LLFADKSFAVIIFTVLIFTKPVAPALRMLLAACCVAVHLLPLKGRSAAIV
jgi:hypothetical protein